MPDGGRTRAEVVQRDLAAHAVEGFGKASRFRHVHDGGGFRNLNDQPPRDIGPGL